MAAQPSPVRREHLADVVFAELGAEILRGEIEPSEALPSEAALSARFGVSKLIVRQAVHRLAEAGLVEVRQGGKTRVADVDEAADLKAIELFYRLAPTDKRAQGLAREVLEKQFTQGLSLVTLFSLRASSASRRELVELVELVAERPADERQLRGFEERFWTAVARGGRNRILSAEVRFWYTKLVARPSFPSPPPVEARLGFYRELARRLADRDGDAVAYYLEALTPQVSALAVKRGKRR